MEGKQTGKMLQNETGAGRLDGWRGGAGQRVTYWREMVYSTALHTRHADMRSSIWRYAAVKSSGGIAAAAAGDASSLSDWGFPEPELSA